MVVGTFLRKCSSKVGTIMWKRRLQWFRILDVWCFLQGFWSRSQLGKRRSRSFRPQLEQLEARLAPAILTVNTTDEPDERNFTLSLTEAIKLANGDLPFASLTPQETFQVNWADGLPTDISRDTIRFD